MTAMSSNSSGWLTSSRPGVLGPEEHAGQHEQGNGGQAQPAAEAAEHEGGEEGAARGR